MSGFERPSFPGWKFTRETLSGGLVYISNSMKTLFPSPIQYIHLRRFKPNGTSYDLMPTGGMTLAYRVFNLPEVERVLIAVARAKCRDDELYNKKTGRDQAFHRLVNYDVSKYDPNKAIDYNVVRSLNSSVMTHALFYSSLAALSGHISKTTDLTPDMLNLSLQEKVWPFTSWVITATQAVYKTNYKSLDWYRRYLNTEQIHAI